MLPKLFITDVDGVLTDGGMYYDENGNELKRFTTSDSAGIIFCHLLKIPVAIITGEETQIVERRAKKLKIDFLFQNVKNKLKVAEELVARLNIKLSEIAYIGDDMNDIPLLEKAGFPGSPAGAPDYVKKYSRYITSAKGGDGAFREFVEVILKENNKLDFVVAQFLSEIHRERF